MEEEDTKITSTSSEEEEDIATKSSEEEDEEVTRTAIRQELSGLSFEELEALKASMGIKEYNEAMFGSKAKSSVTDRKNRVKGKPEIIKRINKNRPREVSSKIRSKKPKIEKNPYKEKQFRDPRFDSSCGELKEELWKTNYSFLSEVQKQEQEYLEQELKKEDDDERKLHIKKQLLRLKNKERSQAAKEKDVTKINQEKLENKKRLQEGKNPYYMKKSTKKLMELAEKYDQLKASGKLEKYLKKKRGKNAKRDRKSINLQQRDQDSD